MKKPVFTGASVAIVTPMFPDESVNYEKLAELIEFQIAGGTDAITICGTTGEASTLKDPEHLEAIRFTVEKVAGRVPVIAGTGSNETAHARRLRPMAPTRCCWSRPTTTSAPPRGWSGITPPSRTICISPPLSTTFPAVPA